MTTTRPLALLAVLIWTFPASAGAACLHNQPPQIAIEARTAAFDVSAAELPAGIEGRYDGAVAARLALTMTGQGGCSRVDRAAVTLTLSGAVHIAPHHAGTCRASVVAEHEAAHLAADREAVAQAVERMRRDLAFLFSLPLSRAEAEDAAQLYFIEAERRLSQDRARAHALIDSAASYANSTRAMLLCGR